MIEGKVQVSVDLSILSQIALTPYQAHLSKSRSIERLILATKIGV